MQINAIQGVKVRYASKLAPPDAAPLRRLTKTLNSWVSQNGKIEL